MPENTRQREAFDDYLGLGAERSIERLHALLVQRAGAGGSAPGLRTIYEWSRRYNWQDRLQRLERQARETADEARIKALREMYERQAQEALLLQQKGAEWLTQFATDEATPDAAIRALVEGAKLERLARGEPSERSAQERGSDDEERFARFTDEELELLAGQIDRPVGGTVEEETE